MLLVKIRRLGRRVCGRSLPRLSVSFKCCPGLTTGRIYAWKEPPFLSETVDLNYVSGENTTPGRLLLLSCAAASEWFCVLRGGWSSVGMCVSLKSKVSL
jgi:hypothetical protein